MRFLVPVVAMPGAPNVASCYYSGLAWDSELGRRGDPCSCRSGCLVQTYQLAGRETGNTPKQCDRWTSLAVDAIVGREDRCELWGVQPIASCTVPVCCSSIDMRSKTCRDPIDPSAPLPLHVQHVFRPSLAPKTRPSQAIAKFLLQLKQQELETASRAYTGSVDRGARAKPLSNDLRS